MLIHIVLAAIALYVGICAAIVLTMLVALAVEQMRLRLAQLRHREVVGQLLVDPVEAAYSDAVGIALAPDAVEAARLRALAAADGAEAAFMTPGCPVADLFLAELFPRPKNAPKEGP